MCWARKKTQLPLLSLFICSVRLSKWLQWSMFFFVNVQLCHLIRFHVWKMSSFFHRVECVNWIVHGNIIICVEYFFFFFKFVVHSKVSATVDSGILSTFSLPAYLPTFFLTIFAINSIDFIHRMAMNREADIIYWVKHWLDFVNVRIILQLWA